MVKITVVQLYDFCDRYVLVLELLFVGTYYSRTHWDFSAHYIMFDNEIRYRYFKTTSHIFTIHLFLVNVM